ncbi:hypothetical protein [Caballeronia sp. Lep1P3]|uniref:hypothetical protein n=1 Tax=Caballeronia sp. Lep1P3 TaxID=2878150 RepID=UPI001FCFE0FA|nr:hypothetical protein [Caballeronia sp. Lep1P3]
MKRIVTHLLVASGLVLGAVGAAQAHSDVHIGLSLGAPAYAAPTYVAPAPVYARPAAPVYGASYWRHDEPRWDRDHGRDYGRDYRHDNGHDSGQWNRTGWDHGQSNGWGRRG